jgi:hypothetical protein
MTIKKGKNEVEYDCLIKIGEINEILEKSKSK